MRWLQFLLSHSIFIAFCAVALCWQTNTLLSVPPDAWVFSFIFFSTLCSYNFYWLLSKYSFAANSNRSIFLKDNRSYLLLFFIASGGMLLSLFHIQQLFAWIIVALLLTVIYSLPLWPFAKTKELRKLGFAKTSLLAFTWAYVTVIIPIADQPDLNVKSVLALLSARFFFMLMLCAIFDHRDKKMDKVRGLHSLATDVSSITLQKIMLGSFIGYLISGIIVRQQLGDNWQMLAFVVTAVVVWQVYRTSLKRKGYHFYYFVVDGMMLFSALLSFIASRLSLYW